MKITCEVETKQWHLHVEINCQVKQTMTLTCESYLWGGSQTMTRSFQMHCTCDDLPSPLSYLSNRFWLWKKWQLAKRQNLSLEECCITCENHLLAQDKIHSMQANFYLSDMTTIQKTHEQIIFRSNIFNMMRKMVCTLYAFLMRFLCVSIFSASSNQPSALLSKFKQLNWTYISSKNNYYIDLF